MRLKKIMAGAVLVAGLGVSSLAGAEDRRWVLWTQEADTRKEPTEEAKRLATYPPSQYAVCARIAHNMAKDALRIYARKPLGDQFSWVDQHGETGHQTVTMAASDGSGLVGITFVCLPEGETPAHIFSGSTKEGEEGGPR